MNNLNVLRALTVLPTSGKKEHDKENQFGWSCLPQTTSNEMCFLEQKIEYLNTQLVKAQKQLEAKTLDFENLKLENGECFSRF